MKLLPAIQYTLYSCLKYIYFVGFIMRKRWFSHIYSVINSTFLLQSIVWTFLDWNFQIKVFVDLVAVDFITSNRFMVIYQFLSIIYHIRYFFFVWLHELHKI